MLSRDNRVKKALRKLKKLEPYKNIPESQLVEKAEEYVSTLEAQDDIDIASLFIDTPERNAAKSLLKKYLNDYTIETISDKNTLRQLIYLEIINQRLQLNLNTIYEETKTTPDKMIETIHKNIREISNLKEKLGITRQKEQLNSRDGYGYLLSLVKKYKMYLKEKNQASRYMTCPHCGESVLLKLKTDIYDSQKHPFFRDRILGNSHLIELYKENKLTKEDLAKIFETSTDYVTWLVSKWGVSLLDDSLKTQNNKTGDSSVVEPNSVEDTSINEPQK